MAPDIETFPPYHPINAAGYLYEGGFRYGRGIVTMLAVGWAESELGKYRRGPINFTTGHVGNTDGSVDRGWLQFNSKAHPEITDVQADDPVLAAKQAWRITEHGERFSQWAAFSTGRHRPHIFAARYAVALYYAEVLNADAGRVAAIALWKGPA